MQVIRLGASVFSIPWNPNEVDSKASKRMDLLARQEQAGREQRLPPSMSFIQASLADGMAQIGDGSSQLKRSGLELCLPISKIQDLD